MQVLFVEPGKEARVAEIEGNLKSMQEMVGGLIQAIYPWEDEVALVCNEEGKVIGLPLNRGLENYDVIAGTFFVCGVKGDSFSSLSSKQMETYRQKFQSPELFFRTDSGIAVKKCTPEEYAQVMQTQAERAKSSSKKKNNPER